MMASLWGVFLEYFWLVMLLLTAYDAWHWQIMGIRLQGRATHASYMRFAWYYFIWAGTSWIIMGWGILSGDARNLIDFLKPDDGQTSVVAFYVSRFVLDIALGLWLYYRDGFAKVADHPGVFRPAGLVGSRPLMEIFYWGWMILLVLVTAMLVIFDPVPASWGEVG